MTGALVGLGLRGPFVNDLVAARPPLGWLEVHSENYFGAGRLKQSLLSLRADYPIALHGVSLGLLSPAPLDEAHLQLLSDLVDAVDPFLVSEHLCWNRFEGRFFHDLLPHPFTRAFLDHASDRISQVQDRLRRPIAVEHITRYVRFTTDEMDEPAFLSALVAKTGCGILLDLENLLLNERNLGIDAKAMVLGLPRDAIREIHLAGHLPGDGIVNDSHAAPVCDDLWALYRWTIEQIGPRHSLLERDNRIPPLADLLAECATMASHLDAAQPQSALVAAQG